MLDKVVKLKKGVFTGMKNNQSNHVFWKIVRFPLTRILLATSFVVLGIFVAQLLISLIGISKNIPAYSILVALISVHLSYRFYVQTFEKRRLTELAADGAVKELGVGLLAGFGLVATIIAILWMLGIYRVSGFNAWLVLIPAAVVNIPSAFVQEILFRGVLQRITEETAGTWIALILSTILFGLIHIISANATATSTIAIMLEAGILLGAAYILTGRLWLAIGIHTAWDFSVDGIFGLGTSSLSGKPIQGLIAAKLTGLEIFTGGAHGLEASIVVLLVALIAGSALTWLAWHNGKFALSSWWSHRQNTKSNSYL
jgi:uncharacterized protein